MSVWREKAWSPYVAGVIIGLLQVPAFLIIHSALGASSSYVSLAGYFSGLVDGNILESAYFEKYMTSLKYLWQGMMVLFIAVGAFISMRLAGSRRKSFSPAWTKAVGITEFRRRGAMAFLGGFFMLFGARWAGGCTSGHGLSGIGQLSVGSLIVVVTMFIGAMAVANLYRRL
ncbi:MAG: YeeE/YedE thiosulfate transporter family protein [Desulfonatronovibrionaceae bacterium]